MSSHRLGVMFIILLGYASSPAHADITAEDIAGSKSAVKTVSFDADLKEAFSKYVYADATTAIYLADAETGNTIFESHADVPLNPASNVKLISTATVFDVLGPEWQYTTRVMGKRPVSDGIVDGSVYLLGEGDPTLGPIRLGELAQSVYEGGVRQINGDVVVGFDAIRDAIPTPLRISIHGAAKAGSKSSASVFPKTNFVQIVNKVRTTKSRRSRIRYESVIKDTPNGARLLVTLTGTVGARRGAGTTISPKLPSTFTAHLLRASLEAKGVKLYGSVQIATFGQFLENRQGKNSFPITLAKSKSAPIKELVSKVNKRSLNGLADRLVMTAGSVRFGEAPSIDAGIRAMREWLRSVGLNPDDVSIDSGSGLSYNTKITARQLIEILRAAGGYADKAPPWAMAFTDSLAIAGVDGTLRSRFEGSDLQGKINAKTGTLTGIIALSGFATLRNRTVAFSIITNGAEAHSRYQIRRDHEHIVEAFAARLGNRAISRLK